VGCLRSGVPLVAVSSSAVRTEIGRPELDHARMVQRQPERPAPCMGSLDAEGGVRCNHR
jgi:hypothetical protein